MYCYDGNPALVLAGGGNLILPPQHKYTLEKLTAWEGI